MFCNCRPRPALCVFTSSLRLRELQGRFFKKICSTNWWPGDQEARNLLIFPVFSSQRLLVLFSNETRNCSRSRLNRKRVLVVIGEYYLEWESNLASQIIRALMIESAHFCCAPPDANRGLWWPGDNKDALRLELTRVAFSIISHCNEFGSLRYSP
ncbi:hypothetical protein PoB_007715300 [Plakobranchus ocellatus]|uniref:Uncharacterized protein n=1 Tax=Plakobranchus ocellatus TaxID=259542 RepID=A0AAV4E390_9GAST|nr:hypothetical protein PoB_007715300 [Plakobranchus ocellatus]